MGARDLLDALSDAGLSVATEGDRLVIRPGSKLTDDLRDALREAKPELLALLHGQTDASEPGRGATGCVAAGASRQKYVERLLRLYWPRFDAEAFADRLVTRDRSVDERVSCFECRHYRLGACGNYRRAGIGSRIISADLAMLMQRCSGFASSA